MCLNLKKGDELLFHLFYISPVHMLKLMGLIPVPVDINLDNLQIDADKIEKISKKPKQFY